MVLKDTCAESITIKFRGPSQITLKRVIAMEYQEVGNGLWKKKKKKKHLFLTIPVLQSNLEIQFMLIKSYLFSQQRLPSQ